MSLRANRAGESPLAVMAAVTSSGLVIRGFSGHPTWKRGQSGDVQPAPKVLPAEQRVAKLLHGWLEVLHGQLAGEMTAANLREARINRMPFGVVA